MNLSRLFCTCTIDLNWDPLRWCCRNRNRNDNQKGPNLENTPHEKEFSSLSLRWFPEFFLLHWAGHYPAAGLTRILSESFSVSVGDRKGPAVSFQAHLQAPIKFGKDSHPKFAPTSRLSLFLIDQSVHYIEGWNFPPETVGIIFYMCCTIQHFHSKLNKSFLLPHPRFYFKLKREMKESSASNVAFQTISRV